MLLKSKISIIGKELFQVALIAYLLLILSETFWQGSVSNYFNLNILLGICLVTGIMMVSAEPSEQDVAEYKETRKRVIKKSKEVVMKIPETIRTMDMMLVRKSRKR